MCNQNRVDMHTHINRLMYRPVYHYSQTSRRHFICTISLWIRETLSLLLLRLHVIIIVIIIIIGF